MIRFGSNAASHVPALVCVVVLAWLIGQMPAAAAVQGCNSPETASSGNVPLPDLASTYLGHQGGLYPGGLSIRPADHLADGIDIAEHLVQPLDQFGVPDSRDGKIVMISVGMSNTNMIFAGSGGPDHKPYSFLARVNTDLARNPQLVVVNGAQGGKAAEDWVNPGAPAWEVLEQNLLDARVTKEQVQIAWIFQTTRGSQGNFPGRAEVRQRYLEDIVRNLGIRFPNIRLAYLTSMHYSLTRVGKTPEPVPYEDGFAVRWVIERQLSGHGSLAFEDMGTAEASGPVPWLSWGPYFWTDGVQPRSDGLVWTYEDQGCGSHPQLSGIAKASAMLYAFVKTDPTTAPWYLRSDVVGEPPTIQRLSAEPMQGTAPLAVEYQVQAVDPDGGELETLWTFGDGTFSYNADSPDLFRFANDDAPRKVFHIPGSYEAYLTVTDDEGNAVRESITIEVASPEPGDQALSGEASQAEGDNHQAQPEDEFTGASVQLTASRISAGRTHLSWESTGTGLRGFRIERRVQPQSDWEVMATLDASSTFFVDQQAAPGAVYEYRVVASTRAGRVFSSNQASIGADAAGPAAGQGQVSPTDRAVFSSRQPSMIAIGLIVVILAGALGVGVILSSRSKR